MEHFGNQTASNICYSVADVILTEWVKTRAFNEKEIKKKQAKEKKNENCNKKFEKQQRKLHYKKLKFVEI